MNPTKRPREAARKTSTRIVDRAAFDECAAHDRSAGAIESALAIIFTAGMNANAELRRNGVTERLRQSIATIEQQAGIAAWAADYVLTERGCK